MGIRWLWVDGEGQLVCLPSVQGGGARQQDPTAGTGCPTLAPDLHGPLPESWGEPGARNRQGGRQVWGLEVTLVYVLETAHGGPHCFPTPTGALIPR